MGVDLGQHALHLVDLLAKMRIGAIDHVQKQIGVNGFLQRGFKGGDQAVGQVADETDRV